MLLQRERLKRCQTEITCHSNGRRKTQKWKRSKVDHEQLNPLNSWEVISKAMKMHDKL